jgi:hypothetical protein
MPRRKNVNRPALLKAVESGLPAMEIMKKFDLKTVIQLKSHYVDALVESGRAAGIVSRAVGQKAGRSKRIEVNNRGSLIVPTALIRGMGFKVGETFSVRLGKRGVSLIKI